MSVAEGRSRDVRLLVDDSIGETRRMITTLDGRPLAIEVARWSQARRRPGLGEIWRVRTGRTAPGMGAFAATGAGADGVLRGAPAGVSEGRLVLAVVRAEGVAEKGPVLAFVGEAEGEARGQGPGWHAPPEDDPLLHGRAAAEEVTGQLAADEIEEAVQAALLPGRMLRSGGRIWIEPTRACVAVDVDAAQASVGSGRRGRAVLNAEAAGVIAREMSVRSLGGLVVVDFLKVDSESARRALGAGFRAALAEVFPDPCVVDPVGRLGAVCASLPRRRRPLAACIADAAPGEVEAIALLRELERAARSAPGVRFDLAAAGDALAWLLADSVGWRAALNARIGGRWRLVPADEAAGAPPGVRRPA